MLCVLVPIFRQLHVSYTLLISNFSAIGNSLYQSFESLWIFKSQKIKEINGWWPNKIKYFPKRCFQNLVCPMIKNITAIKLTFLYGMHNFMWISWTTLALGLWYMSCVANSQMQNLLYIFCLSQSKICFKCIYEDCTLLIKVESIWFEMIITRDLR